MEETFSQVQVHQGGSVAETSSFNCPRYTPAESQVSERGLSGYSKHIPAGVVKRSVTLYINITPSGAAVFLGSVLPRGSSEIPRGE